MPSQNRKRQDKPQKCSLYQISNIISGKSYIGQTEKYTVKNRFLRHLSAARTGRGYALHEAIRKDGEENFVCQEIMCAFTAKDLGALEKELIKQNNTLYPYGYNKTKGGKAGEKVGFKIKFEGKSYISNAALARSYGIETSIFYQRLDRNWTLRQALELDGPPITPPSNETPTIVKEKNQKRKFNSFNAACEYYGEADSKIRSRMKKGETIEEALGLIERNKVKKPAYNAFPLIIDDDYFPSIKAACKFFNLRRDKYHDRKNRGWTNEQIFGVHQRPPRNHPQEKPFEVGSYIFTNMESATRFFGLYQHAISTRLRAGWTAEEAAGLKKRKRPYGRNPISVAYEIDGKEFRSITELADTYSIKYSLLRKRLRQLRWPLRQALGLEFRPSARI